jgi:hypothetical protein
VVPVRASNRVEWIRAEQTLLPRLAARASIDVLHSHGRDRAVLGTLSSLLSIYYFN